MTEDKTIAFGRPVTAGDLLSTRPDHEDHVDGAAGAHVALVLYGDYECPLTRGTHEVIRSLRRRKGIAFRYVFRHFPLVRHHPHAANAARAAEAGASEGLFWPMHDTLLAHQDALDDEALWGYAAQQGVSATAMRAALEYECYDDRIERDVASGTSSGVHDTPVLFLESRRFNGPRRSRELGAAIRAAMIEMSEDPAEE